jgi:uncharacterized protein YPO0396
MTPVTLLDTSIIQFRMSRIQLVNWGAFHGYHALDIHPGGTLLTGPSGTGKSTLLDGVMTVLMDRTMAFNAAAHDEGPRRERTFHTYMRGKVGDRDSDHGKVPLYLREGATWSAIAVTWTNAAGASVTGCRALFITRAGAGNSDIIHCLLISEAPFDACDLQAASTDHLRKDAVRAAVPGAIVFGDDYGAYIARLTGLLGIRGAGGDGRKAIRLLHKTQSSRGVHNIDELFKTFVLDESRVLDRRDAAVEGYQNLAQGYRQMVTARDQLAHLATLPEIWERHQTSGTDITYYNDFTVTVDGNYPIRTFTLTIESELLTDALAELDREQADLSRQHQRDTNERGRLTGLLSELRGRWATDGGADLDRLRHDLAASKAVRSRVERVRSAFTTWTCTVGCETPADATGHDALISVAATYLDNVEDAAGSAREREHAVVGDVKVAEDAWKETLLEIASLHGRKSSIRRDILELRQRILDGTELTEERMPFIAELVDVKDDESYWRTAAERVLRSFALGMLIDRADYPAVVAYVDARNMHGQVRYTPVSARHLPPAQRPDPNTIAGKLVIADTPFAGWLAEQLARSYDHRCVGTPTELNQHPRAVTAAGQIRQRSGTHIKDDRRLSAADHVLGFDNRATIAALEQRAAEQRHAVDEAKKQLAAAVEASKDVDRKTHAWESIFASTWADIDVAAATTAVTDAADAVAAVENGSPDLAELSHEVDSVDHGLDQVKIRIHTAEGRQKELTGRRDEYLLRETQCNDALIGAPGLTDEQTATLKELLTELDPPTLATLSTTTRFLKQAVEARRNEASSTQQQARAELALMFTNYLNRWKEAEGQFTRDITSAPDFLRHRQQLIDDDLPASIENWRNLMRQYVGMGLSSLFQTLVEERTTIDERIAPINEVLAAVEYGHGGHLQIVARDTEPPESKEFRKEVSAILENMLGGRVADDHVLEQRFLRIQALMTRLASSEPADRLWQRSVLEVKRHVRISAHEHRAEGDVLVYDGVGATSGGEGQELIASTLGAALRYQLGGLDDIPEYGAVIVDEGFVKSDPSVTQRALRALQAFGFQLVIAAPIDKYGSMEAAFGSAYVIENDQASGRSKAQSHHVIFTDSPAPDQPDDETP